MRNQTDSGAWRSQHEDQRNCIEGSTDFVAKLTERISLTLYGASSRMRLVSIESLKPEAQAKEMCELIFACASGFHSCVTLRSIGESICVDDG